MKTRKNTKPYIISAAAAVTLLSMGAFANQHQTTESKIIPQADLSEQDSMQKQSHELAQKGTSNQNSKKRKNSRKAAHTPTESQG